MALTSTIHRFSVELSDVERGVYESLDLRVARHPSESARRMLARVLAYALSYEEGIELGRGLSTSEDPDLLVRNLRGETTAWIEVGRPAPERLHKAAKTGARVAVFAYDDPKPWLATLAKATVHRKDELAIWQLPDEVLSPFEELVGRNEAIQLTRSEGQLYLSRDDLTWGGELLRHRVAS